MWNGFTDRELGVIDKAVEMFHASHKWITVKDTGGVDDDKIVKAIRGGNAADVTMSFSADRLGSYCASGAWINLGSYIKRDKVDVSVFPKPSATYTTYQGTRCALPVLADVYGLYYNTDLLKKAGYTEPPKTATELMDMAIKMTTYNGDGSIKVAGFVPSFGFYEMSPAHVAPAWGAAWQTDDGKSSFSKDPHWAAMMEWQKKFVDAIGYDKLKRFTAGAGSSEFSASNLFETRQAGDEPRRRISHRVHQGGAPRIEVRHCAVPGRRQPAEPLRRGLCDRQPDRHPEDDIGRRA